MKIKIYVNYYEVIETTIVTISIKRSHLQNETGKSSLPNI